MTTMIAGFLWCAGILALAYAALIASFTFTYGRRND